MAKLTGATFGDISGRVGNVVFANYNGKIVIKALPKPKKGKPSAKEILQRRKFKLVNELSHKCKPFFHHLKSVSPESQPRKDFFSRAFLAIHESNDKLLLDFSKLEFTRGLLEPVDLTSLRIGQNIELTWNPNIGDQEDELLIFAFFATADSFENIFPTIHTTTRFAANFIIPILPLWEDKPIHIYCIAHNSNGKFSDSIYTSV